MGNSNSTVRPLPPKEMNQKVVDECGFNQEEINNIWARFNTLDVSNNGLLDRSELMAIPAVASNPLKDSVVNMFIRKYRNISGNKNSKECDFIAFCMVLDNFRLLKEPSQNESDSYREKKIRFLFEMYDETEDGKVSKKEFIDRLKLMVGNEISIDAITAHGCRERLTGLHVRHRAK